MTPDPATLRARAESLYEEIGGGLCICQRPDVPHWCESCQKRIDTIAAALRACADAPPASVTDDTLQAPCGNCGCEERDHRGILTCRCGAPAAPAAPEDAVNWQSSYHQACDDADAYKAEAEARIVKAEQNWRSCQREIEYLRSTLAEYRAEYRKHIPARPVSDDTLRALARECAEGLFVNGQGDKADRLVLIAANGRDLGGWGRAPFESRLLAFARAVLALRGLV